MYQTVSRVLLDSIVRGYSYLHRKALAMLGITVSLGLFPGRLCNVKEADNASGDITVATSQLLQCRALWERSMLCKAPDLLLIAFLAPQQSIVIPLV